MTTHSSTIRISSEQTFEGNGSAQGSLSTNAQILAYWQEQPTASVEAALEVFPQLEKNKSLLLDLAIDEFKQRRQQNSAIQIEEFCRQFWRLGSSLNHSIVRALDVQDFLDRHPELLQLVSDFEWPNAGDSLQSFHILEELGRGALARVYLCQEFGVGNRRVVVKIAQGGDYEAALLGRLDHRSIVPIYSVTNDVEHCVNFICMPFRGRSTLQDVVDRVCEAGIPRRASAILEVARERLEPAELQGSSGATAGAPIVECRGSFIDGVIYLAAEISGALAHAHDRDVFHGDLKPSNVLLTADGRPLLIDFNLAKDRSSDFGPRGGTLAYMPPELLTRITGDTHAGAVKCDIQSEVYSFGVLVYQLLTGEVPFPLNPEAVDAKQAAQSIISRQYSPPPSMRSLNPGINADLERLVLGCLAVNPADRPNSMLEVNHQLLKQLHPVARSQRSVQSRPLLTITVMAVCAIMGICGLLYALLRPPYEVRLLARGIAFRQAGAPHDALDYLSRALESNSKYADALYERGKTYLALNKVAPAVADFTRLQKDFGDHRAAVYVGYCFNLQHEHSAAIEWYERAQQAGCTTAGLHNNLAVSYAIGRSRLGRLDRFDAAQDHLEKALALDPRSPTIRRNHVMIALMRSAEDPSYDPSSSVEHVEYMLAILPDDPVLLADGARLYGHLSLTDRKYVERVIDILEASLKAGSGPSFQELSSNPKFEAIRTESQFSKLLALASNSTRQASERKVQLFMDPAERTTLETAQKPL